MSIPQHILDIRASMEIQIVRGINGGYALILSGPYRKQDGMIGTETFYTTPEDMLADLTAALVVEARTPEEAA